MGGGNGVGKNWGGCKNERGGRAGALRRGSCLWLRGTRQRLPFQPPFWSPDEAQAVDLCPGCSCWGAEGTSRRDKELGGSHSVCLDADTAAGSIKHTTFVPLVLSSFPAPVSPLITWLLSWVRFNAQINSQTRFPNQALCFSEGNDCPKPCHLYPI